MPQSNKKDLSEEFEMQSREGRAGLLVEFWYFLRHNKKWWLLPILIALLILGLLVFLAGTSVAPFIYPLF